MSQVETLVAAQDEFRSARRFRLHKSSIVLVIGCLILFLILEVPGRVVHADLGPKVDTVYEHGWPWCYLRRTTTQEFAPNAIPKWRQYYAISNDMIASQVDTRWGLPMRGIPWLCGDNWCIWERGSPQERQDYWSTLACLADILAVSLATMAVVFAWEFRRRRRPGPWGFSVFEFLLGITLVGVLLGYTLGLKQEYDKEQSILWGKEEIVGNWYLSGEDTCTAPLWSQQLFGLQQLPEWLWRTTSLTIDWGWDDEQEARQCLDDIGQFKYVSKVEIRGFRASSFPFSRLRVLPHLHTLNLDDYQVLTLEDVRELSGLTRLRTIIYSSDTQAPAKECWQELSRALPQCRVLDWYEWVEE